MRKSVAFCAFVKVTLKVPFSSSSKKKKKHTLRSSQLIAVVFVFFCKDSKNTAIQKKKLEAGGTFLAP